MLITNSRDVEFAVFGTRHPRFFVLIPETRDDQDTETWFLEYNTRFDNQLKFVRDPCLCDAPPEGKKKRPRPILASQVRIPPGGLQNPGVMRATVTLVDILPDGFDPAVLAEPDGPVPHKMVFHNTTSSRAYEKTLLESLGGIAPIYAFAPETFPETPFEIPEAQLDRNVLRATQASLDKFASEQRSKLRSAAYHEALLNRSKGANAASAASANKCDIVPEDITVDVRVRLANLREMLVTDATVRIKDQDHILTGQDVTPRTIADLIRAAAGITPPPKKRRRADAAGAVAGAGAGGDAEAEAAAEAGVGAKRKRTAVPRRALPATDEDARALAATYRHVMLGAYRSVIHPDSLAVALRVARGDVCSFDEDADVMEQTIRDFLADADLVARFLGALDDLGTLIPDLADTTARVATQFRESRDRFLADSIGIKGQEDEEEDGMDLMRAVNRVHAMQMERMAARADEAYVRGISCTTGLGVD